jgi:heptosyltransferase I
VIPASGRLLIVKTSSMGDLVHALPAVSDIRRERPRLTIDWLAEARFAGIPRLHPAVQRVIPIAARNGRMNLLRKETRVALALTRAELKAEAYDLVIDLQGLLRSALWGLQARGPLVGGGRANVREPLAALLYHRAATVPPEMQAVERCRRLVALHLGFPPPHDAPEFGIQAPAASWEAPAPSAVLIPCASRPRKLWPDDGWIAIGQRLQRAGLRPVVLWGNAEERARAERIASGCGGLVPPFLSVGDVAAVLARARQIVGLDTGFSHLGAAFGVSTIGIYCDYDPGTAAVTGPGRVASLGGRGQPPSLASVLTQLERHLEPA